MCVFEVCSPSTIRRKKLSPQLEGRKEVVICLGETELQMDVRTAETRKMLRSLTTCCLHLSSNVEWHEPIIRRCVLLIGGFVCMRIGIGLSSRIRLSDNNIDVMPTQQQPSDAFVGRKKCLPGACELAKPLFN